MLKNGSVAGILAIGGVLSLGLVAQTGRFGWDRAPARLL